MSVGGNIDAIDDDDCHSLLPPPLKDPFTVLRQCGATIDVATIRGDVSLGGEV